VQAMRMEHLHPCILFLKAAQTVEDAHAFLEFGRASGKHAQRVRREPQSAKS